MKRTLGLVDEVCATETWANDSARTTIRVAATETWKRAFMMISITILTHQFVATYTAYTRMSSGLSPTKLTRTRMG